MTNNLQKVFRIEHREHRNMFLQKAYPASAIKSGLYSFFCEYDPFKFNPPFVHNETAINSSEEMKFISDALWKMEEEFQNPRERELRDRITEKGKAGQVTLRAPACWNFKRPNAFCDPFLRETFFHKATKNKLPLYAFRNQTQMYDWFNNVSELVDIILKTKDFNLVQYHCYEVYHGLRQSIFYPTPGDKRTVLDTMP